MNKGQKTFSGILAFLPLVIFIIYISTFFYLIMDIISAARANVDPEEVVLNEVFGIVGFAILLGLVSLGVLVYFIIHVINNNSIDNTEKLIWILVFLFAGMIGYPVYWVTRIANNATVPNNQARQT